MGFQLLGTYRALIAERDGKRHTQARRRRIDTEIRNLEFMLIEAGLI